MDTQVWVAKMAAYLPEDVLKLGCTELNATGDSEERQFLLCGESAEAALRGAIFADVRMSPWDFGPVPEGTDGFCVRTAGGLGEPEMVTIRPFRTPAPAESP